MLKRSNNRCTRTHRARVSMSLCTLFLALCLGSAALRAQIPNGWCVVSHFRICNAEAIGFPPGGGGLFAIDPEDPLGPGSPISISTLRNGLTGGGCMNKNTRFDPRGAWSVAFRSDGSILVGEVAKPGDDLDLHLITLKGFDVQNATSYHVLTVEPAKGWSSIDQIAVLEDDSALFTHRGPVGSGDRVRPFLARWHPDSGVETVELSLFGAPAVNSYTTGLAVDPTEEWAYVGVVFPSERLSQIYRVQIAQAFAGAVPEATPLDLDLPPDLRPIGNLAFTSDTVLVATAEADLIRVNLSPRLESETYRGAGLVGLTWDHSRQQLFATGFPQSVVELQPDFTQELVFEPADDPGGSYGGFSGIAVSPLVPPPAPVFRRGDTDGSGIVDISDPIYNLNFQFVGGIDDLPCEDAADVDDSGVVDISDPIYNLTFQFVGGIAPPSAPGHEECGPDPTADDNSTGDLGCESYTAKCAADA